MSGQNGREERVEALVIGGGAAGLSGAVALARSRRSVLVVDGGQPRNAPAGGVHNYLGREGTPPGELLAAGREELRRYGGRLRRGEVVAVTREDGGDGGDGGEIAFRVTLAGNGGVAAGGGGVVRAERLLVATGVVDELPEVPGVAGLWGRDVLHCPYCHGFEVRDRAIGVLATHPMAAHMALLWRQLSQDVTLFRHTAELGEEDAERLAARGVALVEGEVVGLATDGDGRLAGVRLAGGGPAAAGGRVVPVAALAVGTRLAPRAGFLEALGLVPEDVEVGGQVVARRIAADPMTGATAVPGVWVAGNLANPMEQVIGSAAGGLRAGAMINADLVEAAARRAVAARRSG